MNNKLFKILAVFSMLLCITNLAKAQSSKRGTLSVGAAKINYTPPQKNLPKSSYGILDSLYCRAIVIDNKSTEAALVSVDIGALTNDQCSAVIERAQKELGIPAANIFITATHTHSSIWGMDSKFLTDKIFKSIEEAKSKLQPAKMGYGTGLSYLNINRNIIDKKTGKWWEGPNYDGVSDKTVYTIFFKNLKDEPIAVYYNYAMHAVITGNLDMVSADVPGATSTYIENSYDNKIVALWSEGAAGDQNPKYFQQTFDLRNIRIKEYAKKGKDISNAMPPGGTGLDRSEPKVAQLMNQQKQMKLSMGQLLGEEVMHTMREMNRFENNITIKSANKILTIPGRIQENKGRAGYKGAYKNGPEVHLKLCLLEIDDIALAGINAEIFNEIAIRLKNESPFARTMMVTLTNGTANSGYVPNDAAFGYQTFEVLSSRCKPGYAENGIINGFLDLMQQVKY
ncbi:MAG: neutral/alkaline non-lysosomal ceramidase N-terminal domain-containing protein [Bacteroidales bacterium]|jgi:hypothetical protein|nr:neutral/alkaline non-lysosomal ceramidase N-terminal domain-containing protein [Bacteroidales bacterium]